jgi:hypothetical protein
MNAVVPLWSRLLAGLLLSAWGGLTGRTWTIPVALLLGTPHLWLQSFVVLAAIPRLRALKPEGASPSRAHPPALVAQPRPG